MTVKKEPFKSQANKAVTQKANTQVITDIQVIHSWKELWTDPHVAYSTHDTQDPNRFQHQHNDNVSLST